MQALRHLYHRQAYRQETNYQLNYFTLAVKDPELQRAINEQRKVQNQRVIKPWIMYNLTMAVALGYSTWAGSQLYVLTNLGCLIASIGLITIHFLRLYEHAPLVLYI